jgi:ABC-type xylose transport system permease subunit
MRARHIVAEPNPFGYMLNEKYAFDILVSVCVCMCGGPVSLGMKYGLWISHNVVPSYIV